MENQTLDKAVTQIVPLHDQELAVVDLGYSISPHLVEALSRRTLEYGKPVKTGGPLGTACLPIAGAGSAIASSLAAGNVFLATANPATLMPLGHGVGSAVMAATGGGIVGQAPFIAASSALIPVVAPILLFTTFSSMMMSVRLDRIERALVGISETLNELLKLEMSEDLARFLSATERLNDIHQEYRNGPGFTDEMKMRLALVERDVNILRHKHHILATEEVDGVLAAKLSETQKRLFVASSIADAQADQLRLLLALQDNPADATRSRSALEKKAARYEDDFGTLAAHSPTKKFVEVLQNSLDDMGWWKRHVFKKGDAKATKAAIEETDTGVDLSPWGEEADNDTGARADPAGVYSMIFWRDHGGKGELKAWYTADYELKIREEPGQPRATDGPAPEPAAD